MAIILIMYWRIIFILYILLILQSTFFSSTFFSQFFYYIQIIKKCRILKLFIQLNIKLVFNSILKGHLWAPMLYCLYAFQLNLFSIKGYNIQKYQQFYLTQKKIEIFFYIKGKFAFVKNSIFSLSYLHCLKNNLWHTSS